FARSSISMPRSTSRSRRCSSPPSRRRWRRARRSRSPACAERPLRAAPEWLYQAQRGTLSEDPMGMLQAGIIPVTPFQQNCTILFDSETKEGVVVDPGGDVEVILKTIEDNGIAVK